MENNYSNWNRITLIAPPDTKRILVSDGEVQVIAQYIDNHWIFDNAAMKDMVVLWWQELEDNPPKIVSSSLDNV